MAGGEKEDISSSFFNIAATAALWDCSRKMENASFAWSELVYGRKCRRRRLDLSDEWVSLSSAKMMSTASLGWLMVGPGSP